MHAHTIASKSFSILLYLVSLLLSVLVAYATGLSDPIVPWDKIAPNAALEASVVKINGYEKSGYCNIGELLSIFLQVSQADIKFDHDLFWYLF